MVEMAFGCKSYILIEDLRMSGQTKVLICSHITMPAIVAGNKLLHGYNLNEPVQKKLTFKIIYA